MVRAGQGIILIAIALLGIGVVMVGSAGLSIGEQQPLLLRDLLTGRPALFAVLSVGLLAVGAMTPIDALGRLHGRASPVPWLLAAIIAVLILVHVPGVGREINGARRWVTLGPIGFQPSEVAKWGMLLMLASYAASRGDAMRRFATGVAIPAALIGVICLLIVTEDLGTAVLAGLAGAVVLLAGGARLLHLLALTPLAALGVGAALLHSPYRLTRLQAFLDPYADPQGTGYHMIQSMAAVSGGGLAGRGLGNSVQKFGYLPEDTTDFIFAIVCEELGLAGAGIVIALYAALCLCALSIVRRTTDRFCQLLAIGIVTTIGLQALINLAVVTGCAPTKGIALPLISWGGTGWLLTSLCLGLLVSIDRRCVAPDDTSTGDAVAVPCGA